MNAVFPTPDAADSQRLLSPDELEAALRDTGARRDHNLHPFHRLLHRGERSKNQARARAPNRHTNPVLVEGSPERADVEAAGWTVGHDGLSLAL